MKKIVIMTIVVTALITGSAYCEQAYKKTIMQDLNNLKNYIQQLVPNDIAGNNIQSKFTSAFNTLKAALNFNILNKTKEEVTSKFNEAQDALTLAEGAVDNLYGQKPGAFSQINFNFHQNFETIKAAFDQATLLASLESSLQEVIKNIKKLSVEDAVKKILQDHAILAQADLEKVLADVGATLENKSKAKMYTKYKNNTQYSIKVTKLLLKALKDLIAQQKAFKALSSDYNFDTALSDLISRLKTIVL